MTDRGKAIPPVAPGATAAPRETEASGKAPTRLSRGVRLLAAYRAGGKLTPRQMMHAKCADCTNLYADGMHDCGITSCPLYPYMPYRNRKRKEER